MNSRSKNLRLIRYGLIGFFSIIIILYAIFRSLNYTRGLAIDIYQPLNGSAIASTTVNILGKVQRVNSLTLNGKSIFIDEQGNFNETIIIFPGINSLTFDAKDQFGREKKVRLDLVGTI